MSPAGLCGLNFGNTRCSHGRGQSSIEAIVDNMIEARSYYV
jgi:hypothetical protein